MYRFLLAQLQVDSLTDAETIESLKTRLEALSSTIDEQYDSIMKRIMNGSSETAKLAMEVLMFTTISLRPLSSIELQHALAARIGDPGPARERVPLEDRLVEVCAGMVVLEKETNNIKLVSQDHEGIPQWKAQREKPFIFIQPSRCAQQNCGDLHDIHQL